MQKVNINAPTNILFSTKIAITIQHINYGGHVGNSAYLDIAQEARLRFLDSIGLSEIEFDGSSLIMGNVAIVFRKELFRKDQIEVHIAVEHLSTSSFDLVYDIVKKEDTTTILACRMKTGMICFDYKSKQITPISDNIRSLLAKKSRQ